MKEFQVILTTPDDWLWGNWLLLVLLSVGLLYAIMTGGIQVRRFGYIIKKTIWEPVRSEDKGSKESETISFFQALCAATAFCMGNGDIVGVSTAVLTGGMGAVFWMWVATSVEMATKYSEITLGMLYREKNEEDDYVSGPMYYIEKGLRLPWLAALYAFLMVTQIIGGNLIQSNTIGNVMKGNFGVPCLATDIVLVLLIFIIALGGLKRLTRVTQTLVPSTAVIYVVEGMCIILANITKMPGVFADILTSAFDIRAMARSAMGAMLVAMQRGVARGLYSGEAGKGSVPVIHSATQVNHPIEQGVTGVAEVFLDTFVVCTITGLILGVTGVLDSGAPGSVLAVNALASVWEPLRYVMALCLLLFSPTTLMSQWYFGFMGLNYIFGAGVAGEFKYILSCFYIVGTLAEIELVWVIQDITLGLLTVPNLVTMMVLAPQVRKAAKEYFSR